ncbi:MAG: hypothetical protein C5B49_12530 [Bdellovibrio sp.]|nr:MAG: hypothetical protein C5B49_12530 [Bdellovibrio sp.]
MGNASKQNLDHENGSSRKRIPWILGGGGGLIAALIVFAFAFQNCGDTGINQDDSGPTNSSSLYNSGDPSVFPANAVSSGNIPSQGLNVLPTGAKGKATASHPLIQVNPVTQTSEVYFKGF